MGAMGQQRLDVEVLLLGELAGAFKELHRRKDCLGDKAWGANN